VVQGRNGIRKSGEDDGKHPEYNLDMMHTVTHKIFKMYCRPREHQGSFATSILIQCRPESLEAPKCFA
jgi:hypothetical protein